MPLPPIRLLDDLSISRIAAGEVIERPSSVAKELLENSLDAGATAIKVEFEAGGRRLIRVTDNGRGIPADQVALAFQRHATSKIASSDDLAEIASLGFRGEALASIAAVAHVTMLTRAADEETGTRIRIDNGRVLGEQPIGAPAGTSVTVENLFNAVPARLKFLKSEPTEAGRILEMVTQYALAYPDRRFTAVRDGRTVLQSPGTGDLQDSLRAAFGAEVSGAMIALAAAGSTVVASEPDDSPGDVLGQSDTAAQTGTPHLHWSQIAVRGYVSPPHLHRATRRDMTLFVNGRVVSDASLNYAIQQAYHTLIPKGRFPVAVVMVELPAGFVDVNVHPAKTEVRFHDSRPVFSAVERAVRAAVLEQAPVAPIGDVAYPAGGGGIGTVSTGYRASSHGRPSMGWSGTGLTGREGSARIGEAGRGWLGSAVTGDQIGNADRIDITDPAYTRSRGLGGGATSDIERRAALGRREAVDPWVVEAGRPAEDIAGDVACDIVAGTPGHAAGDIVAGTSGATAGDIMAGMRGHGPEVMSSPQPNLLDHSATRMPMLRVLGQVALTFIAAEGPDGLYLIDQHAAHERVMYEVFMARRAQGLAANASQQLIAAETLVLSATQMGVVEENLDAFTVMGFDLEPFGGDTILVRAIPEVLSTTPDIGAVLRTVLDLTLAGQSPVAETFEARLVRAVCKQATVKAGQVLGHAEMRALIESLEACASPRTCPHGRPTMIVLPTAQLAREFGR